MPLVVVAAMVGCTENALAPERDDTDALVSASNGGPTQASTVSDTIAGGSRSIRRV